MIPRRHRHHHPVDGRIDLPYVRNRDRAGFGRDRARPVRVVVGDGDEIDLRGGAENAGVVPPEMADADHRRAESRRRHDGGDPGAATALPTTAMPAAFAASNTRSPSSTTVRPASTDSTAAPAAPSARIVGTPITGTSKRMS